MKLLIRILALAVFAVAVPVLQTGCPSIPAPQKRVVAVQTLLAVAHTAEDAVKLAGDLYLAGQLTLPQMHEVVDFYNRKWKPAYKIAKDAALGDLSSAASPDVAKIASDLLALVLSFTTKT